MNRCMIGCRAQKQTGFTVVELLIVIVVIAILATISIVAYNGIQNRANDTAVQADIRSFASKVMEFHAINGRYPQGSGNSRDFALEGVLTFSLARGSYSTDVSRNFSYCTIENEFAVGAVSKSGNRYYVRNNGGNVQTYTGSWGNNSTNCGGMIPEYPVVNGLPAESGWSFSFGYRMDDDTWSDWVE